MDMPPPGGARWWPGARAAALALAAAGALAALGQATPRWPHTEVPALVAAAGSLLALRRERRARVQATRRERELGGLLGSVQELIFRTDASGAITYANARWAALDAAGPDAARGRRLWELVAPADRPRAQALFRVDDRSGMRRAQLCLPAPDGRLRHVQVAVLPLQADGAVVGFAASATDISERVAFDLPLPQQPAFSALLLELSPLPVALFDAQGLYLMVNQAWEGVAGRPRAQLIGTPAGPFLCHDGGPAPGGRLRHETQVRHGDGSLRDMVITQVRVPGEGGAASGVLCTLMDVSEFRDAERATREARDAAEQASRAKSEFVANISHELRTPLQAILGFSELGFTRGREQARLAGMFSDIHRSGQRMLALVNDLLDVAKIESAVGTLELQRCDLRALVQAVLLELDPLLGQRRLRVALQLADEALVGRVDPLRMHQALRNVVANAIRFSPEGGVLEIAAQAVSPQACALTVADRGPGIPPAELESIFEAFVQSSLTKNGAGGTGLGLAICRTIIDVHGGHISAANRAGGGAVFTIRLPLSATGDSQVQTEY